MVYPCLPRLNVDCLGLRLIELATFIHRGPNGEITDYASKQWAGLVIDYYSPRWSLFFDQVTGALANGTEFNQARFQVDVLQQEQLWQHGTQVYATVPVGDTVKIVETLHQKYSSKKQW